MTQCDDPAIFKVSDFSSCWDPSGVEPECNPKEQQQGTRYDGWSSHRKCFHMLRCGPTLGTSYSGPKHVQSCLA